ncbi:MAG: nucleoside phosphorylase [Negativicutes bacterium]|jgi:uridine phosphorylase
MTKAAYPILECPANRVAVLNANAFFPNGNFANRAVLCFFKEVIEQLADLGQLERVGIVNLENGLHPIYTMQYNGEKLLVMHPGVGAPYAAAMLEGLISMGAKNVVACGGGGVLNRDIVVGHLVVPTVAVRDEGTSYKYLPAAAEVLLNKTAIDAIGATLNKHNVPYIAGKVWTTDALFRETPEVIAERAAAGCVIVEMECAAFAAVAEFRNIQFGQILYGGDDVTADKWDGREWQEQSSTREKLFWLAVEAACAL